MRHHKIASTALLVFGCFACSSSKGNVETSSGALGTLSGYDPAAAVQYADANWNNGDGTECAAFTSNALLAGNAPIQFTDWVYTLVTELNVPFEEHAQGDSGVVGAAGDVVVYSDARGSKFCDPAINSPGDQTDPENCGHVCLVAVGGTGASNILADCHNNAHYHIPVEDILGSYTAYRIYHLAKSLPSNVVACSDDSACNHGDPGTQDVCSTSEGYCIKGCHSDFDCPGTDTCAPTEPHYSCQPSSSSTTSQSSASAASNSNAGATCDASGQACNAASDSCCDSNATCDVNASGKTVCCIEDGTRSTSGDGTDCCSGASRLGDDGVCGDACIPAGQPSADGTGEDCCSGSSDENGNCTNG